MDISNDCDWIVQAQQIWFFLYEKLRLTINAYW